jgi:hypothetical protein
VSAYDLLFNAAVGEGEHDYLSTHCLHAVLDQRSELHGLCSADRLAGQTVPHGRAQARPMEIQRNPAQCKHCGSRCVCWCHQ